MVLWELRQQVISLVQDIIVYHGLMVQEISGYSVGMVIIPVLQIF